MFRKFCPTYIIWPHPNLTTPTMTSLNHTHHEEGGVGDSPGRGDDLPAPTMDGLCGYHSIQNLEFHVADGWTGRSHDHRPVI